MTLVCNDSLSVYYFLFYLCTSLFCGVLVFFCCSCNLSSPCTPISLYSFSSLNLPSTLPFLSLSLALFITYLCFSLVSGLSYPKHTAWLPLLNVVMSPLSNITRSFLLFPAHPLTCRAFTTPASLITAASPHCLYFTNFPSLLITGPFIPSPDT